MELDPGTGANRQFEKQEKQAHPLVSEDVATAANLFLNQCTVVHSSA